MCVCYMNTNKQNNDQTSTQRTEKITVSAVNQFLVPHTSYGQSAKKIKSEQDVKMYSNKNQLSVSHNTDIQNC